MTQSFYIFHDDSEPLRLHFKVGTVFLGECMPELQALKLGVKFQTFPDLSY